MCTTETIARYSREHNGANVSTLGSSLHRRPRRGDPHRRDLAGHADARGALHPTAAEDPRGSKTVCAQETDVMLNPQDLQRLIDIITEEVIAAQARRPARVTCACHGAVSTAAPTGCAACSMPARRGSACTPTGGAAGGVVGDDRPHAAEAGRDARRHREAVSRGRGVPLRDRVRQPGVGRHRGGAAARQRRRRLLRRRVSARRDDRRRQELRDAAGDLRRRHRDRHGDQHRRAEVRRPAHGRARHRGRGRAMPAVRRHSAR